MGNNNTAFEGLIFGFPHLGICRIQPALGNKVAELTFCLLPADDAIAASHHLLMSLSDQHLHCCQGDI
uniref:Uncharacterized protein n=1 Tax=Oryza meridionalis TaxID=40149 RepID=A0A0E0EQ41_9ORYZ